MHNETIASRLRAARQAVGMSQAAVGAALEPPKPIQEISRYERNGATPSVATVMQLAKAMGVSPCWLAFGEGQCNTAK